MRDHKPRLNDPSPHRHLCDSHTSRTFARDLRLSIWPRNVTKTVTKESSIVLAKRAKTVEAVVGAKLPPERISRPYRGCTRASTSQIPEKMAEYIERQRMDIESQLVLFGSAREGQYVLLSNG
jgi:hypothetical protein